MDLIQRTYYIFIPDEIYLTPTNTFNTLICVYIYSVL